MLVYVILLFTWVIHRMYGIYSKRIYLAISDLNKEVQKRETFIYKTFLVDGNLTSDYGRFRVYPKLHVIFTIIAATMAMASLFAVSASVSFDFTGQPAATVVAPTPVAAAPKPPKASKKSAPTAVPAEVSSATPPPAPATATSASPNVPHWVVGLVCLTLFGIFEFVLLLLRWHDSHMDGHHPPITVSGGIQVDLKGRGGSNPP